MKSTQIIQILKAEQKVLKEAFKMIEIKLA